MNKALVCGSLIDGLGAQQTTPTMILIKEGRIESVHAVSGELQAPEGYQLMDARGYTAIPGLIDAHVHIQGSGEPDDNAFFSAGMFDSIADVTLKCYKHARQALEAGWTTLRDAACRDYADVAVRNAINRGDLVGPRLWVCGLGITSTAGHMDSGKFLSPQQERKGLSAVADDPTEGRKAVRQNLRFNVDFIKINATLTEHVRRYQGECAPEMTQETMQAIIEEAHWHGRKVTAHCYGGPGATWAIEAGVDGIEHGFYLTDEHLAMMAERGTVLCPTLSVPGAFREYGERAFNIPGFWYWRDKAIASAWKTTARAKAAGVRIICGTDAAMPFIRHGDNATELMYLEEAGLSPMEVLISATSLSAEMLGIQEVGAIKPGYHADIVLVDGNPLENFAMLRDLKNIPLVIKGGEVVADRRITA